MPPRSDPPVDPRPAFRAALLAWYDECARDLPWRDEDDPYRVWVSEVMLQQTRVSTVLGYYEPWLERFPDVEALAAADLDEVLLAWEGLGYYRRARFLHAGARLVREEHGGRVPDTFEGLKEIPGLGDYAAGAVASIAFGRRVPAVDGNVRRVLSRWFDEAEPGRAWLRDRAAGLVDPGRPGDWNQALMELGATVCTPTSPSCEACPVAGLCLARAAGTQEDRPKPSRKQKVRAATLATAVVVDREGLVLLVRRAEEGLLGGMWSFPEVEMEGWTDVVAAARGAAAQAGVEVMERAGLPRTLAPVRHRFSHIAATYRPVVLAGRGDGDHDRRWADPAEPDVALPVAQQKILAAARAALGEDGDREPLELM